MTGPARWFVVGNPVSGGGRAMRLWPRLAAALTRQHIPHEFAATSEPGDATRLATAALAAGHRRLLAIGGDGTFNELVNGLFAAGPPPPDSLVAAAAAGTGNDWARTMTVPDDPDRLAGCMARSALRRVDLGLALESDGRPRAWFHNVAGAGLDAEVLRRTPRRGPRSLAYLAGLTRTLARYRSPRFTIRADGRLVEGVFWLASIAIGPRCGGGMRLAPRAIVDDGWFDLVTVNPLSLGGTLARLPKLFDGRLDGDPAFQVTRCRRVVIEAEPGCGVQVDGQSAGDTPVTLSLLPGALGALDCRASAERAEDLRELR
jgi:YegS/Rv2252/BmrU family lipid kinase